MALIAKGAAPAALDLRRSEAPMPSLGADARLTIRELLRVEWRAAVGAREASAFTGEDGRTYIAAEGVDLFDALVFAAGAIDAETGDPLWEPAAVMAWPNRPDLWADIRRVARAIEALSEVGADATKSGDPAPDPAGGA